MSSLHIKIAIICGLCAGILVYVFAISAPQQLNVLVPKDGQMATQKIVSISYGQTVNDIAIELKEEHVIRSTFVFKALNRFVSIFGDTPIQSGDYAFMSENIFTVYSRLLRADYGLVPVKITFPEGITSYDMADILATRMIHFNKQKFIALAQPYEGFLFPDTYFFMPTMDEAAIVKALLDTFTQKTKSVVTNNTSLATSTVILASIVEAEARQTDTRRIVAGILLKRLELGMPLQVDATFRYINGKTTATLTADDLKIKSPYNTYVNKGLPVGAINNPGLDAIDATLNPRATPYLYFLTDDQDVMHYAVTFKEHVANKIKYLK